MAGKIPTQNFIEEYRVLYHAFHQLNRLCWQNRLPLCQIEIFSRRGRVLGLAVRRKPYLIRFNLLNLVQGNDNGFIAVMAHEMTHIWQYEKGERGGHRADFKNEMSRIGIDYKQFCGPLWIRSDSAVGYCVNVRRIMRQDCSAVLRVIAQNPCSKKRDREYFEIIRRELF